jgi:hypothetical protein
MLMPSSFIHFLSFSCGCFRASKPHQPYAKAILNKREKPFLSY